MTDFNRGGDGRIVEDDKTEVKGHINSVVNTPVGNVMVTPTANYGSFVFRDVKPITGALYALRYDDGHSG